MLHFDALVHNANQLEKEYKKLLLSLTLTSLENFALKNEVGRLKVELDYQKRSAKAMLYHLETAKNLTNDILKN